jgi:hypothetical protein
MGGRGSENGRVGSRAPTWGADPVGYAPPSSVSGALSALGAAILRLAAG